jgi:small subunit ribosomal protein S9
MNKIISSGKRKTSIARAVISTGTGEVSINGKNYKNLATFDRLSIEEPLRIAKNVLGELKFNILIKVKGGGEKSRIEASRLALARAIIQFTKSDAVEDAFLDYDRNLIVADVRRKEANKPGDSKARAKRQTSYR